eukprot:SRR837773.13733.p2 GENE.SRR837773.13733~~SRR837773.13733.p2  ORF type:complete len:139 (-),score=19.14 SRR837773.13733:61-438(-)
MDLLGSHITCYRANTGPGWFEDKICEAYNAAQLSTYGGRRLDDLGAVCITGSNANQTRLYEVQDGAVGVAPGPSGVMAGAGVVTAAAVFGMITMGIRIMVAGGHGRHAKLADQAQDEAACDGQAF